VPSKSAVRVVRPSKGYERAKARSLASLLTFQYSPGESDEDTGIETKGIIVYKSMQILAFADDIDTIGGSEKDIKKSFIA
jgi:hypothetical protein